MKPRREKVKREPVPRREKKKLAQCQALALAVECWPGRHKNWNSVLRAQVKKSAVQTQAWDPVLGDGDKQILGLTGRNLSYLVRPMRDTVSKTQGRQNLRNDTQG